MNLSRVRQAVSADRANANRVRTLGEAANAGTSRIICAGNTGISPSALAQPRTAPPVFADPEPLLPEPVPVTGSLFHGPDDDDEPDLASLELFTIGEMATQVGRTDKTLKTWEKNGWLPHSRYTIAHSGIVQGRRLYTERQVQAVIDAMEANPASLAEMGEMIRSAWAVQGALAAGAPELGPADDDDTDVIRVSMTGPSPAGSHDAWSVLVP